MYSYWFNDDPGIGNLFRYNEDENGNLIENELGGNCDMYDLEKDAWVPLDLDQSFRFPQEFPAYTDEETINAIILAKKNGVDLADIYKKGEGIYLGTYGKEKRWIIDVHNNTIQKA